MAYEMAFESPALPGHREANCRRGDVPSQKSVLYSSFRMKRTRAVLRKGVKNLL